MTTTLYLDAEYNGHAGALMSLALVKPAEGIEAPRFFYSVIRLSGRLDPWVAENVVPVLGQPAVARWVMQYELGDWLSAYEAVTIVADWPDDIAYFCRALITGPGRRMKTPRLAFQVRYDLNSDGSIIPHNALEDAKAIARMAAEIDGGAA